MCLGIEPSHFLQVCGLSGRLCIHNTLPHHYIILEGRGGFKPPCSQATPDLQSGDINRTRPPALIFWWRIGESNPSEILGASEVNTPSIPIPHIFKTE